MASFSTKCPFCEEVVSTSTTGDNKTCKCRYLMLSPSGEASTAMNGSNLEGRDPFYQANPGVVVAEGRTGEVSASTSSERRSGSGGD